MKSLELIERQSDISIEEMKQAELKLGFSLPDNYKEFLFKYNGGHPIKDGCPMLESFTKNEYNYSTDIAWFFSVYDGEYNNLVKEYLAMRKRIPSELLTIACNSGGDNICLSISGANKGRVYFWFHENENPELNNAWYENIFLVANTFEDFINSMYAFDTDWEPVVKKSTKYIYTHDRYSLPLSTHVQRYGSKVTEFFAKTPAEVEDFIIEEIKASGNIVLSYVVKSQNMKYVREMNKLGHILSDYEVRSE